MHSLGNCCQGEPSLSRMWSSIFSSSDWCLLLFLFAKSSVQAAEKRISQTQHIPIPLLISSGAWFSLVTRILLVSTRYSEWFWRQFLIMERYLGHQSTHWEKSSFNIRLEGVTVKRKSRDKATTAFIAHYEGGMRWEYYILGQKC